jgi:hypothetical protein
MEISFANSKNRAEGCQSQALNPLSATRQILGSESESVLPETPSANNRRFFFFPQHLYQDQDCDFNFW